MGLCHWKITGAFIIVLSISGCNTASPSTLDPHGPGATEIAFLWWIMFWLATFVFIAVMGLLLYALRRESNYRAEKTNSHFEKRLVIIGGIIVPTLILLVIYGFTLRGLVVLAAPESSDDLVIKIIGRQWWWEVHYPNQGVVTANEIHLPISRRVTLQITSGDVIHSFWVPELHGKIDMIPDQTNTFWLEADTPGIYYGVCAEFCGIQHAKMAFRVVAEPEEEFERWLESEHRPAATVTNPLLAEGQQVFLEAGCINCHAIRGTHASGALGPDLTHVASRSTLAAGILDNNRGNLSGWIVDPQGIKPGAHMPPTDISGPELQALLAYLESLE